MRFIRFIFIFLFIFISSCSKDQLPSSEFHIYVPTDCELIPGQKITVALSGTNIPADAVLKWSVTRGEIEPSDDLSAIFTAPNEIGPVVILVSLTSKNSISTSEKICEIKQNLTQIITQIESSSTANETDNPSTPNDSDDNEFSSVLENSNPVLSILTDGDTLAISEIMANPCNNESQFINEYIEIYNYGNAPIDINGSYIMTTSQNGEPDKIVSWKERNGDISWGTDLIFDTTIIKPKQYALILSPVYTMANSTHYMPYTFPKGTVILTIEEGDRIGNKTGNILGVFKPLDSILLFTGSPIRLEKKVSTYGLDPESVNLEYLYLSKLDDIPFVTQTCNSVQRKYPSGDDIFYNWEEVPGGNPGTGPYN